MDDDGHGSMQTGEPQFFRRRTVHVEDIAMLGSKDGE
jgi:hypothetical protein